MAIPRPPAAQTPAGRGYRPEIDGLRALAILPVLFFHAELGFPGGYVGVDVFFVISGYLITSLIVKELDADRFSLLDFWARRARRIVPAALALTAAVLAMGWALLLPADFASLGRSVQAQAVFGSNIFFWRTSNYFSVDVTNTLPLLHTWSLAVEEQFYVCFPLMLMACFALAALRRRSGLAGVLAAGFLLSLAASAYGAVELPNVTFYVLPTRAWELLTGSLLAVCPAGWTTARQGWREGVSVAGLLAILAAVFGYDKATVFPGLAALPPCLGAAAIIWSNGPGPGGRALTAVGRVLASPVPVFIGLISYSLYLWHWPLFAFSLYYRAGVPLPWGYRAALAVLALVLATLSWAFVESPFRRRRVFASQTAVLAFAVGGLTGMLVLGTVISARRGFPGRFSPRVNALADARLDGAPLPSHELRDVLDDRLLPFGTDRAGVKPTFFVWGDSHAAALVPALDLYARRHGLAGRAALHPSTSPLLDYYTRTPFGMNAQAVAYSQAVFDYIGRNRISHVFLGNLWERDLQADPARLENALARTITAFRPTGARLYVFMQVPRQPANVPRALALDAAFSARGMGDWRKTVQAHALEQAAFYRMAARYGSPGCVFIDPAPVFADPDGQHYQVIRDGHPLYWDDTHISAFGAANLVEPLLERVLDAPTR